MSRLINLAGQQFGRLTVIERAENRGRQTAWLCRCKCGEEVTVVSGSLQGGRTKSCGCLSIEETIKRSTSHGLINHPLYRVWKNIKIRCYNKSSINYNNYGERGIKICDAWKDDFKAFYDWCIKNGWEKGLEIDRIDCNGNYEPDNCRFVTKQQNLYNTRPRKGSTSEYKGVSWSKHTRKWTAGISVNGKQKYIGTFENEIEAAIAYDDYAEEFHGEYAWLNRDHFEEVMDGLIDNLCNLPTEWIDTEDSGETLETILQRKTKFQPGNVIEPINGGRSVTIKKVLMYSERTYSYLVESPVFGEQVLMQSIESKFRRIK